MTQVYVPTAVYKPVDSDWLPRGPRNVRITGDGDGVQFSLTIKEKEVHGYTMEKLQENALKLINDLREDGHQIDAHRVETQMMYRVVSI